MNLGDNYTAEKQSNPLENLKPASVIPASELDTGTNKERKLLYSAIYEMREASNVKLYML
jgi:hypothetical protein